MAKRRFHWEKEPTPRPTDLVIRSSLPQWVVRVLRQSGIKRMSVIATLSDQQLLQVPGIGRRAVTLIRNEIRRMPGMTHGAAEGLHRAMKEQDRTAETVKTQEEPRH